MLCIASRSCALVSMEVSPSLLGQEVVRRLCYHPERTRRSRGKLDKVVLYPIQYLDPEALSSDPKPVKRRAASPGPRRPASSARAKRLYRSPHRRQRAEVTRQRITASARRLFATRGYAATSMDAIAADAGVAVPTVYAAMRSKRAILLALLDAIEQEAGIARLQRDLEAAHARPLRQLEIVINLDCRLFEENLDVLESLREARAADPDLTPIWRAGGHRRRRGQARLLRSWGRARLLAPGLRQREAADILWALTGPDVYRLFVVESHWPAARFRKWLRGVLATLLLKSGRAGVAVK